MPPRYNRKKKVYRKKRFTRRSTRKQILAPKMYGKIKQPVHYFKRFVDRGLISADGAGTETTGALAFSLDNVPGFNEFTVLYDAYKIVAVKVMFIPYSDNTDATFIAESQNFMRFMSCIDYNDSVAPASLNTIREYSNCKVTRNNVVHKRYFYPKVNVDVDFQMSKNPWVETSNSSMSYLSLKYGFEQPAASAVGRYRVECVYYMKFKAAR